MSLYKKIISNLWVLRSLPQTIYFNFHYLPFSQAIHLPIVLYKPKFVSLKGKVIYEGQNKFGRVLLGNQLVPLYPNSGIVFENLGGTIVFRGNSMIGGGSAISVGKYGRLYVGDRVVASASFRLVAWHSVRISDKCRFGWECVLMDSDMHKLKKKDGGYTRGIGEVVLGDGCWVCTRSVILKNTILPAHTTVQSQSVLSKSYEHIPECSVIGTKHDVIVKAVGVYRDMDDDIIDFSYKE